MLQLPRSTDICSGVMPSYYFYYLYLLNSLTLLRGTLSRKKSLITNLKEQIHNYCLPAEAKAVLPLPKLGTIKNPSHADINKSSNSQTSSQMTSNRRQQGVQCGEPQHLQEPQSYEFGRCAFAPQRETKSKWFRTTELAEFMRKKQTYVYSSGA